MAEPKVSLAQVQRMFRAAPAPILILAPDAPRYTIVGVNDAYLIATMRRRVDLLGRPLFEAFPENPDDHRARRADRFRSSLDAALRARAPDTMAAERYDIARPDGGFEERWWQAVSVPVLSDGGAVEAIVHQVTDVTRQRAADDALRDSNRRLAFLDKLGRATAPLEDADAVLGVTTRMLGEEMDLSVCAYADMDADEDGFTIRGDWAAPSATSIVGHYNLADFGRLAVANLGAGRPLVINDMAEIAPEEAATFQAIGIAATICLPLVKNGRLVALMATHRAQPHRWSDAELALVREVTDRSWAHVERVAAVEELRALNETLEQQVAQRTAERDRVWLTSRDLLIVIDAAGTIRGANPAWRTVLDWSEEELLGRSTHAIVHPDDHARMEEQIAAAVRRPVQGVELRLLHRDGSHRWISWVAAPDGDLIFGNGRDITEDKATQEQLAAAQEQLRQSQKLEAMGSLTGGVAHDFNNLLTPIVATLDLLERRGVGGEREQRLIGGAIQSADRAKTLVQRLLAFARRQPLQSVPVDVVALSRNMAELVASTAGPQIRVIVDAPDGLPTALADPNQLEMAILNLAVNARDAMPAGGALRISVASKTLAAGHETALRPGDYLALSVADTGSGMDAATLARSIEPFFSTKGIGKGTGLGLSMVHGLASQLGGALEIHSKAGLGTNVVLWLPAGGDAAAAATPAVARGDAAAPGAQRTALLVDDEEIIRESTADMLGELGYTVVQASSAEEALSLIHAGAAPDIVVTDHLMPGMNGTDLAHAAHELLPATRVLIVSGFAELEAIEPGLARLAKPFRKSDLSASLAALDRA